MRVSIVARQTPGRQDVILFPVQRDWRRLAKRFAEEDLRVLEQADPESLPPGMSMLIPLPGAKTRLLLIPTTSLETMIHTIPSLGDARLILYEDFLDILGDPMDVSLLLTRMLLPRVRELVIVMRDEVKREQVRGRVRNVVDGLRILTQAERLHADLLAEPLRDAPRLLSRIFRFKHVRVRDMKASRIVLRHLAAHMPEEPSYLIGETNPQPGRTLFLAASLSDTAESRWHASLLTSLAGTLQHDTDIHLTVLIILHPRMTRDVRIMFPSFSEETISPSEVGLSVLADAFTIGRKYKPRQTITFGSLAFRQVTSMAVMHTASDIAWEAWRESLEESLIPGFRIPLPPSSDTRLRMLRLLHTEARGHSWIHLDLPDPVSAFALIRYIRRVGKITHVNEKA